MPTQMVNTDPALPTFVGGVLVPFGGVVSIPDAVTITEENSPNLGDAADAPRPVPYVVSAIGPTGPAPTMPQQTPPGVLQDAAGFSSGTHRLYAEGAADIPEPLSADERAELDRFRADAQARAANAAEAVKTGDGGSQAPFDAKAVIDGTIPEVAARIDGLTDDQKNQVKDAEKAGSNRAGVLNLL